MRIYFLILMLLLLFASARNVFAQPALQPFIGFAWPTHNVPVLIEAPQSSIRQLVLNAMRTWNLAQEWFITTYMGQGTPFVLYETNSTLDSIVTISFNQTQTIPDYLGWTDSQEFHDRQGDFKRVIVSITIDLTKENGAPVSDVETQTLATHELGHALGLDHTTFNPDDLMNPIPTAVFPSTLNLYAVYLLSEATNIKGIPQQPVSLPGNIPYKILSQDDLKGVTARIVQTTQINATSSDISQLVHNIAYGPWLWIGLLVVLASVILISTTHRRRLGSIERKETGVTPSVIVQQKPTVVESPVQRKKVKICRYCKAEVLDHYLICPSCGMPASYL